ncbi:MAG: hypothetical protein DRH43_04990 [Deltaproteobacteria bacterium]|nr:MAG: hypothetical protein DRH43_04990 [Deltaproteobacteria bacterium]
MSKLALRAQTVDIAKSSASPRFVSKKPFNDLSKEFLFGQQPVEMEHWVICKISGLKIWRHDLS